MQVMKDNLVKTKLCLKSKLVSFITWMCLKAEVSIEKFESLRVVPFKVGITCLNSLKHCFKWALLLLKSFIFIMLSKTYFLQRKTKKYNIASNVCNIYKY